MDSNGNEEKVMDNHGNFEGYNLNWFEFEKSFALAAKDLRADSDLTDMTIVAAGQCFYVHRLVLAAASPLLRQLFKNTRCQHPIMMLPGISASDMRHMLDFIYEGHVSIAVNSMSSLLHAAELLDIRALLPAALVINQQSQGDHPQPEAVPPPQVNNQTSHAANCNINFQVNNRDSNDKIQKHTNNPLACNEMKIINEETSSVSNCETKKVTGKRRRSTNADQKKVTKRKEKGVTKAIKIMKMDNLTAVANKAYNTLQMSDMVSFGSCLSDESSDEDHSFRNIEDLEKGSPWSPDSNPSSPTMTDDDKRIQLSNLPVNCKFCGKIIKQSRNLRRHIDLVHLREDGLPINPLPPLKKSLPRSAKSVICGDESLASEHVAPTTLEHDDDAVDDISEDGFCRLSEDILKVSEAAASMDQNDLTSEVKKAKCTHKQTRSSMEDTLIQFKDLPLGTTIKNTDNGIVILGLQQQLLVPTSYCPPANADSKNV